MEGKAGEKKDDVVTFFSWVRLFRVFKNIMLAVYPEEIQGVLRHEEIVQALFLQRKEVLGMKLYSEDGRSNIPS